MILSQVELHYTSLNKGDVFILDEGMTIHCWNGSQCSRTERMKVTLFLFRSAGKTGGFDMHSETHLTELFMKRREMHVRIWSTDRKNKGDKNGFKEK